MFEFDQYLGFLIFMTILTMGFWLMILLLGFIIPYWVTGSFFEWLKERKKKIALNNRMFFNLFHFNFNPHYLTLKRI